MGTERYTYNAERHHHFIDGLRVPGVTTVLKDGGAICYKFSSEDALYRGNYVHAGADLYNKKILNMATLKPEFRPYIEAWIQFMEDTGAVVIASELHVYSLAWRYAGILDSIVDIKGRRTLIDVKTGADVMPSWELQTAGYKIAYQEMLKHKLVSGKAIQDRMAVQLKPTGKYIPLPHKGTNDENEYLSFVVAHKWRARNNMTDILKEGTNG